MIRLGSENSRPNGGYQEHAPILNVIYDTETGKGLIKTPGTRSVYDKTWEQEHTKPNGGSVRSARTDSHHPNGHIVR